MNESISRRHFLQAAGAAAALHPAMLRGESDKLGKTLPLREFKPGGEKITALGLGGHHVGMAENEKTAQALIERAIERGIRVFDNAVNYQSGLAERYYGKFLTPKYRDQIFLTTKSSRKTAAQVRAEFEDSLRRMKTERIDLWQIHTIGSAKDVNERIEAGVVDVFIEMREKKRARYIGFTGHRSQAAHCHFIDWCAGRGIRMDACLMPINLFDNHYDSFVANVLPKLIGHGISPHAMKTMAFGNAFRHVGKIDPGVITAKNMHEYAYSLPVSCLISGCETVEQIDQNANILENFEPMDRERMDDLIAAVKPVSGAGMESYKSPR